MYEAIVRVLSFIAALAVSLSIRAEIPQLPSGTDVFNLPLEELAKIEVTSVARRAEPLRDAAAAIFVLTRDDIIDAGVRSIPDALRLVPGVEVARVDGNKWAVSIRGFNSRSANKLLVLVDGRSVYDPLFSGVFWEVQDVPFPLIDRIEVIRGPGGTQWGANAVNGVINIITRRADEMPTFGAVVGGGDFEREFVAAYGTGHFDGGAMVGYAKRFARGPGEAPGDPGDEIDMDLVGLRSDLELGGGRLMLKAEGFSAAAGTPSTPTAAQRVDYRGANLTFHWEAALTDGIERWVQGFFDRFVYDDAAIAEERVTGDLEFRQVHGAGGERQIAWGFGYRNTSDRISSDIFPAVTVPEQRTDQTLSAFVEGQFAWSGRDRLTIGTKVEHNDYTGVELQPSVRYAHRNEDDSTNWAAVSRAVRVPSRLESDLAVPGTFGNPDMAAEVLLAYEVGHRRPLGSAWWLAGTAFIQDYDELRTIDAGMIGNGMQGRSLGAELALRWQPDTALRGDLSYAYLDLDMDVDPGSTTAQATVVEGNAARHRIGVHLAWDPRPNVKLDGMLRHVSRLPTQAVDAYTVADLRFAWQMRSGVELALVGRDLFSGPHAEQNSAATTRVGPSVYLQLRWQL